jgi:threonyl-tRNA synthetase
VTIGPKNGFYYDFYREEPFSKTAARHRKEDGEIMARRRLHRKWDREETKRVLRQGRDFKVELVDAIPAGQKIQIYKQGQWSTSAAHACATRMSAGLQAHQGGGRHWRATPTRYFPALRHGFATRELDDYLTMMEEAEKRTTARSAATLTCSTQGRGAGLPGTPGLRPTARWKPHPATAQRPALTRSRRRN